MILSVCTFGLFITSMQCVRSFVFTFETRFQYAAQTSLELLILLPLPLEC